MGSIPLTTLISLSAVVLVPSLALALRAAVAAQSGLPAVLLPPAGEAWDGSQFRCLAPCASVPDFSTANRANKWGTLRFQP